VTVATRELQCYLAGSVNARLPEFPPRAVCHTGHRVRTHRPTLIYSFPTGWSDRDCAEAKSLLDDFVDPKDVPTFVRWAKRAPWGALKQLAEHLSRRRD
jgi:hypothetical protein